MCRLYNDVVDAAACQNIMLPPLVENHHYQQCCASWAVLQTRAEAHTIETTHVGGDFWSLLLSLLPGAGYYVL